uniref:Uncharacterized protein n=1 Tax=Musca domestica TaxID=7370 RepID=A0A1I8NKG1_MUSDO
MAVPRSLKILAAFVLVLQFSFAPPFQKVRPNCDCVNPSTGKCGKSDECKTYTDDHKTTPDDYQLSSTTAFMKEEEEEVVLSTTTEYAGIQFEIAYTSQYPAEPGKFPRIEKTFYKTDTNTMKNAHNNNKIMENNAAAPSYLALL